MISDDEIREERAREDREYEAIEKKINPVYIQVDEPFLSTGLVDLKVASKAIDIIGENLSVPLAMHVCGNLDNVFKDLIKFNIDILDCEFAGNDINIKILEENSSLIRNKKIGFGCLDTSINEVDSKENSENFSNNAVSATDFTCPTYEIHSPAGICWISFLQAYNDRTKAEPNRYFVIILNFFTKLL